MYTLTFIIITGIQRFRRFTWPKPVPILVKPLYDKRVLELVRGAESTALPDSWIRFELEFKGDKADWVTRHALDDGFTPTHFAGVLRGLIDFREGIRKEGQRKDRLRLARWWKQFVNQAQRLRVRVPKPIATIERKKKWIMKSVAPTLALLQHYFDGDMQFIYEAIHSGNKRLTPKHMALLETVTHGV